MQDILQTPAHLNKILLFGLGQMLYGYLTYQQEMQCQEQLFLTWACPRGGGCGITKSGNG